MSLPTPPNVGDEIDRGSLSVAIVNVGAEFAISSAYVARWWLPTLGPTSTALLQLLPEGLGGPVFRRTWECADLANRLGIGHKGGHNSPLARSLGRLCQFRVVELASNGTFYVRSRLGAIDLGSELRLRPAAREQHRAELEALRAVAASA